jgi:hypothetical protein
LTSAVLALGLALACSSEKPKRAKKPRGLPLCPEIAATVNGKPVAMRQIQFFAEMNLRNDPLSSEHRNDAYHNGLNELIRRELIRQEAEAQEIVVAPADLETAEKEARASFPNEATLLAFLAAQSFDLEAFREELRIQEQCRLLMAREAETKVPLVSAAEGEQFYYMYNPGAKKPSPQDIESWRWQVTRNKRGMAVRNLLDALTAKATVERYFKPGECRVGAAPRPEPR